MSIPYRDESVTQSAFDLAKLDAVAAAIDALAKALIKAIKKSPDYTAVTKTLNATQRFDTADFVDLGHFCQELSKRSTTTAVKAAAKATIGALTADDGFVVAERHKGAGVSNASGRGHLLPARAVNKAYASSTSPRRTGGARSSRRITGPEAGAGAMGRGQERSD